MKRVLVLHALSPYHRATTFEFVTSFGRYAPKGTCVEYHNIRNFLLPEQLKDGYDALILPYDILSLRSSSQWDWVVETTAEIREFCDRLIAFPQDDYTYNRYLDEGLEFLSANTIYSPIEDGLGTVYPRMSKVAEMKHALTGYADEEFAEKHLSTWIPMSEREIDVGTRVRMLPAWFGRYGQQKGLLAEAFKERALTSTVRTDISTNDNDVFAGDDWYRFLGSCRTTIGQKGGASLCDPDGSLMKTIQDYIDEHPDHTFDQIEQACFSGLDGLVEMKGISPRLFDSASLGVPQILIRDNYLDVLEPWVHYLPTDSDLSNFEEIEDFVKDFDALENMADAAAEVLVREGRFTYKVFVEEVFRTCIGTSTRSGQKISHSLTDELQWLVTPELFESIQRFLHLAVIDNAVDVILSFVNKFIETSTYFPELISYLDEDLFNYLATYEPLGPNLNYLSGTIVDILRESAVNGALTTVKELLEHLENESISEWNFKEWTDFDQIELQRPLND